MRFIEERENHARGLGGMTHCTFCAVERPQDHPRRPEDYVPLDEFWRNRGYLPRPDLPPPSAGRIWTKRKESPKPMSFWIKEL